MFPLSLPLPRVLRYTIIVTTLLQYQPLVSYLTFGYLLLYYYTSALYVSQLIKATGHMDPRVII